VPSPPPICTREPPWVVFPSHVTVTSCLRGTFRQWRQEFMAEFYSLGDKISSEVFSRIHPTNQAVAVDVASGVIQWTLRKAIVPLGLVGHGLPDRPKTEEKTRIIFLHFCILHTLPLNSFLLVSDDTIQHARIHQMIPVDCAQVRRLCCFLSSSNTDFSTLERWPQSTG
jgi:hypothetical protein